MIDDTIAAWAAELQSLAQAGLYYGRDVFDRERYERIRQIANEMMSRRTGIPEEPLRSLFCADSGYQTPKVETRAAVFQDEKILLVQERDGRWSLPGGWCDYDLSPVANTVKEAKEEAGMDVAVELLIAAQDRKQHNVPVYSFNIVKLFYLCRPLGGAFVPNSETLQRGWFSLNALPPLAENKNNTEQIALCFQAYHSDHWTTFFD